MASRLAVSPASKAAGSDGITRQMQNTTAIRPAAVGTNQRRRLPMRARMRIEPSPSLLRSWLREGARSLLVVSGPHLLRVADRTEDDALQFLRVRAIPLGIVDP